MGDSSRKKYTWNNLFFDIFVLFFSCAVLCAYREDSDSSDDSYENKVKQVATKQLKEISKPSSTNCKEWEMQSFKLVGYNYFLDENPAGEMSIQRQEGEEGNFIVTIPVTYKGINLNGAKIKRMRNIEITISELQVVSSVFKNDRRLTLWSKLVFWFKSTYYIPGMVFILLLLWSLYMTDLDFVFSSLVATRGTKLIGSLNSFYASFISWESYIAVIGFSLFYLGLYFTSIWLLKKFLKNAEETH